MLVKGAPGVSIVTWLKFNPPNLSSIPSLVPNYKNAHFLIQPLEQEGMIVQRCIGRVYK